jgi:phospholipid/cholesterol/gamma-HCH transport system permease protein
VGLISLLIGVVLVYQGATQLKRFGAEIFTVDLLAVSILREVGVLLTSIVVAGRSGSAFAAQIGTMKLNQEIDAMTTMGLNPITVLVIPRVLALMVMLPILTFWSDIMGVLGGALMSMSTIDLSLSQFLRQFNLAITPWTFWVGMIKAPVFAFLIALIGCFEGLRVHGGAESVGRHTTNAVVKGIFMVIVSDALFSIIFSKLGW